MIRTHSYCLDLRNTMKIDNIFHLQLLDLTANDALQGQIIPPPPQVEDEGEEEWQVQEVFDSKCVRNRLR